MRDLGRYEEALDKATHSEAIWRELARAQRDAYNGDWATSLANLAHVDLDLVEPKRAIRRANEALALLGPLFDERPDPIMHWIAFTTRSVAEAELMLNENDVAGEAARKATTLWSEVQAKRPGFEIINSLRAVHTLMRYFGRIGDLQALTACRRDAFVGNSQFILRGGDPMKRIVREIVQTALDQAGEDTEKFVPEQIRRFVNLAERG